MRRSHSKSNPFTITSYVLLWCNVGLICIVASWHIICIVASWHIICIVARYGVYPMVGPLRNDVCIVFMVYQWLALYMMTSYVLLLWCTNGWPFTWWHHMYCFYGVPMVGPLHDDIICIVAMVSNGWPFTWWYYHTALNALLWCAVVKSEGCYTSCLAWLQALHLIGQLIANKRKQEIQLFLQPSALITFLWRHATWCSVTTVLCNSSKVQTKSLVWKRKTLARAVWRITMNNYIHLWRMSGKFHHGL